MPESKKRDKKGRLTKHAKTSRSQRQAKKIRELRHMISVLDEWPSEDIDYTQFKKETT